MHLPYIEKPSTSNHGRRFTVINPTQSEVAALKARFLAHLGETPIVLTRREQFLVRFALTAVLMEMEVGQLAGKAKP